MGTPDEGLSVIMSERRQLINLAYRLLGSLADAEDVVQETYARWYGMSREQQDAVENPGAWLTTVASRICLDQLGSARARRERYVGEWLPEPVPDQAEWASTRPDADPADRVTLDESVTMAVLVVLDAMTPAERVAFVLHDVFGYPFPEVAEIVGRSPAACRQLATSARRRIASAQARAVPAAHQAGIVRKFKQAWQSKNIAALIGILDPDVVTVGDGGGLASAMPYPVRGVERVAGLFAELAGGLAGITLLERTVNGRPGLVGVQGDVIGLVMSFEIAGDRITNIWAMRNPEKLRPWSLPTASD